MSDKVVHLITASQLDRGDALALLADLNEMAETGGISAIGVVAVKPDGTVAVSASRSDKAHHLVAGTVYLQRQLCEEVS